MNNNNNIIEPDTKCQNIINTTINESESNLQWVQPHSQLLNTYQTSSDNQAIDISFSPGTINARFTRNMMTPEGMREVILLTDSEIDMNHVKDYIPHVPLPEQGHNYSGRFTSTPVAGNPQFSMVPTLSDRTEYYLKPFKYYSGHILAKIICKPALSQSQNFWVSRTFVTPSFSNNQHLNAVGFNWNPSRQNVVYVLMPWSYTRYLAEIATPKSDIFGYLNIKETSTLVYNEGNEIPLTISVYFSPVNFETYDPIPVTSSVLPGSISVGNLLVRASGASISPGTVLGTVTVTDPISMSLSALSMPSSGGDSIFSLGSSTLSITSPLNEATLLTAIANTSVTSLRHPAFGTTAIVIPATDALLVQPLYLYGSTASDVPPSQLYIIPAGNKVNITASTVGAAFSYRVTSPLITSGNLYIAFTLRSTTFTNMLSYGNETSYRVIVGSNFGSTKLTNVSVLYTTGTYDLTYSSLNKMPLTTTGDLRIGYTTSGAVPTFAPTLFALEQVDTDVRSKEILEHRLFYDNFPSNFKIKGIYHNDQQIIAESFMNCGYPITYTHQVISQDPSEILVTAFSDNKVIFIGQGMSSKAVKRKYCALIYQKYRIVQGVEEIFEYQYNPISSVPDDTYGKMIDHNVSEDHHNMRLTELTWTAANKFTPQTFNVNLSAIAATYPFINTREYHRHVFKSRMPIIIIRANKNPYSNVEFRAVLGTYTTYDQINQLPGTVWDPTVQDIQIQPYWNFQDPAVTDINFSMTIMVNEGQIDDAAMSLVVYFSTSPLLYKHKKDYDSSTFRIRQHGNEEYKQLKDMGQYSNKSQRQRRSVDVVEQLGLCDTCYCAPCACERFSFRKLFPVEEMECSNKMANECLEKENLTKEDSTNKIEGTTMETLPKHMDHEMSKVQIEKAYNYVGKVVLLLSNATNNLNFVAFPIYHVNFGKQELTTAKRYFRWKGLPRFRITLATSSVNQVIPYATVLPASIDVSALSSPDEAIYMFEKVQMCSWNNSTEIQIPWLNTEPWQKVDYSTSMSPQLGNLVLAFPTPLSTTSTWDNTVKIVLECDTSNITYDRRDSPSDYVYHGIQFSEIRSS